MTVRTHPAAFIAWLAAGIFAQTNIVLADATAVRSALKVCADPYNLPSSSRATPGYENRIAELFGRKLGLPVTYTWFPQRLGFIRNTLTNNETPDGSYKCDLVLSVTERFDMAAVTRPYMRSTWVMVYVKGRGLDFINSQEDLLNLTLEQRGQLRIGMWDKGPTTEWLSQVGLVDAAIPYQSMSGDPKVSPGQIIERDLIEDKINLTFVWGPIGGYYAKQIKDHELRVIPMQFEPGLRFDFQIAMAVRHADGAWRAEVNRLIADNQAEIDTILTDYGVPLLPLLVTDTSGTDDDDDD